MNRTIKSLKKTEAKLHQSLFSTRQKISELVCKENLPITRKKYVGKYFKYKNSGGGTDKYWFIYIKVLDIYQEYGRFYFKIVEFQIIPDVGKIEINIGNGNEHIFQKEISKKEYEKERKKLLELLNEKL